MRPGEDMLTVQEADRLGRNLLKGLIVLNDLFQQGIQVKILAWIAAGEHTERSLILDLALALAEDRRRDIVRKTRDGLVLQRHSDGLVLVDLSGGVGSGGGRAGCVDGADRWSVLSFRASGQGSGVCVGAGGGSGTQERLDSGRACR